MLVLQSFQLPVETVVLGVGDLRRVIDVVATVVVTDLLAQILYPAPHVHASGHAGIIRKHALSPKRRLIATAQALGLCLGRSATTCSADCYRNVMGSWPKVYLYVAVPLPLPSTVRTVDRRDRSERGGGDETDGDDTGDPGPHGGGLFRCGPGGLRGLDHRHRPFRHPLGYGTCGADLRPGRRRPAHRPRRLRPRQGRSGPGRARRRDRTG